MCRTWTTFTRECSIRATCWRPFTLSESNGNSNGTPTDTFEEEAGQGLVNAARDQQSAREETEEALAEDAEAVQSSSRFHLAGALQNRQAEQAHQETNQTPACRSDAQED